MNTQETTINTNLLYEIAGLLDNIDVLQDCIELRLEPDNPMLNELPLIVANSIKDARQLSFVVDTQLKAIKEYLNELIEQAEKMS